METTVVIELVAVLAAAGFISGLGGFAFSGVASLSLWLLPPLTAIPLLLILSTATQCLSISSLWRDMRIFSPTEHGHGAWPYMLGGLVGAPFGILLLQSLPGRELSALLGVCLCVFALVMLAARRLSHPRHARIGSALLCGWAGGLIGGFSAFPSAPALAYLSLLHMPRTEIRGQLQPFVLVMQLLSLSLIIWQHPGLFNSEFLKIAALCLPGVVCGTTLGIRCYRRLGDWHFRQIVLVLLLLSGLSFLTKFAFL